MSASTPQGTKTEPLWRDYDQTAPGASAPREAANAPLTVSSVQQNIQVQQQQRQQGGGGDSASEASTSPIDHNSSGIESAGVIAGSRNMTTSHHYVSAAPAEVTNEIMSTLNDTSPPQMPPQTQILHPSASIIIKTEDCDENVAIAEVNSAASILDVVGTMASTKVNRIFYLKNQFPNQILHII